MIEVVVTVVVLTVGILAVYEGFLITAHGFNYALHYLTAQMWIDEKIWDIRDKLVHNSIFLPDGSSGIFYGKRKRFNWVFNYTLLDNLEKVTLYEINLAVDWKEGAKNVKTQRNTYLVQRRK